MINKNIRQMTTKFFQNVFAFFKNIGRKKEDISWKEISGMTKTDK